MPTAGVWLADELAAWSPPEQLDPAEWAEKYRELSRRQSSRPGPWRHANQPAAVGLMVLAAHPAVREIWAKKSAQFGASEAVRNVVGWFAHLDPCPVLLVLPDEKTGRKLVRKRVIPLFEDTGVLAGLLTGNVRDKKLSSVTLTNGFELSLGWAGSPASLAADPQRVVVLDEVDKYGAAAQQADPVAEARVRTRTYDGRSLLLAMSTPSTPLGPIAVGYDDCPIKLAYHAPCPHCGRAFRPRFDRLAWEKYPDLHEAKHRAARILTRHAAWIECDHCAAAAPAGEPYPAGRRILNGHRRAMLAAGWWATDDQGWRIHADGRFEGEKPEGERVGLHVHALIDLSVPLWKAAADFVACDGRAELLKDFHNTTLGEEFREATGSATVSVFRAKCVPDEAAGFVPPPPKLLQPWVSRLTMCVDTQKDYFWFTIRGWGHGLRSHRVHHGRAASFREVEDLYYNAYWAYAGGEFPARRCFGDAPLAIDSGGGFDRTETENSITAKVYEWCLRDAAWRYPTKGASKPFEGHIKWRDLTYQPPGAGKLPYTVRLHFLDPIYWRDLLAGYVAGRVQVFDLATGEVTGEVDQWQLNAANDEEYNRHLSAVHKVKIKKGRAYAERYVPKSSGARHDYHDVEAMQVAWAHGPANCSALPSPRQMEQMRQAARAAATAPAKPAGVRMPDGRSFFSTHRK